VPGADQILVKVSVCGVCRTDLHVLDGELTQAQYPIIPGHQIVGTVEANGADVTGFSIGQRVGIPWLGGSCRHCDYCLSGKENLCFEARYTGCQINGGFADYCVADYRYAFALPDKYPDLQVAPLLCAGLIGYRAYHLTEPGLAGKPRHLGLMGFGASAHILAQLATVQGDRVYAFTREGDTAAQDFARQLGATWAGNSNETPDTLLDSLIIFAPAGELVPRALALVRPGGNVVCAGIHMSTIPAFDYDLLWGERRICSVANLTRQDGEEFMALAAASDIHTDVHPYPLDRVNEALADLRAGRFTGAAVITVTSD
jgi:propanol-preferring alcohol dehydrogenase